MPTGNAEVRVSKDDWLTIGMGWESRRLVPIIEDLDSDGSAFTPERCMAMMQARQDGWTDEMRACKRITWQVEEGIENDEVLRERFAAKGVQHVDLAFAITDSGWEPKFKSPRYKLKRRKKLLDVDAWAFYDGPVEPEPFAEWLRERLLGDLQGWLG